ncbi:MAG: phosphohydrolase [Phototrophicales bacterium]|nr:MAG: phosphohydrolase [Phototrophicales bacterium]
MTTVERMGMSCAPDFEGAKQYAFDRLERELDEKLTYHSIAHTRDDVLPAVERLAHHVGITGERLLLLKTAAVFHDLGFVENTEGHDHESRSARIVREVLPNFGYTTEQINTICRLIMATKVPQQPEDLLESLLVDADLDSLGRSDYFTVSGNLRRELSNFGIVHSDLEWYQWQLEFLSMHDYFSEAARELRDHGKQHNINIVSKILAQLSST